jgi:hypothetical protein
MRSMTLQSNSDKRDPVPELDTKPVYVIRFIEAHRYDGRRAWTSDNTYLIKQQYGWDFDTLEKAQEFLRIEKIPNAKIYQVEPAE